jgi:hypothetical protein
MIEIWKLDNRQQGAKMSDCLKLMQKEFDDWKADDEKNRSSYTFEQF